MLATYEGLDFLNKLLLQFGNGDITYTQLWAEIDEALPGQADCGTCTSITSNDASI
jgi:hypothetical protein